MIRHITAVHPSPGFTLCCKLHQAGPLARGGHWIQWLSEHGGCLIVFLESWVRVFPVAQPSPIPSPQRGSSAPATFTDGTFRLQLYPEPTPSSRPSKFIALELRPTLELVPRESQSRVREPPLPIPVFVPWWDPFSVLLIYCAHRSQYIWNQFDNHQLITYPRYVSAANII